MSQRFGRAVRLRTRPEFLAVQGDNQRVTSRHFTLLARPSTGALDRLGVIASRKLGNAVVRNRAKRRLREIFRRLEPDLTNARGLRPLDLVVIPRRESVTADAAALAAEFSRALRRIRTPHE